MVCGVYVFKSEVRGYFYVGSSQDVIKRKKTHLTHLRKGVHHNVFFQRVFDKYGEDNLEFEYRKTPTLEDARLLEQKYLDKYVGSSWKSMNIGANASGGDNLTNNPNRDSIRKKITKSVRKLMRELTPDERCEKFGRPGELNGMWGKTHTVEARKRLSEAHTGNTYTLGIKHGPESRRNMSDAAKRRVASNDYVNPFAGKSHSEKMKQRLREKAKARVAQGILPSNTRRVRIKKTTYRSLTQAAKAVGVVPATVLNRIRSDKFPEYRYLD